MAPRTQKEEALMGEASRNLMEKAKETGSQQLEKAQDAVKQVAEKADVQPRTTTQPKTQSQPPRQHPGPTAAGPDKKGAW